MNSYNIRPGYMPRLFPSYFHDTRPDGKHWQPDIIPLAVHLARTHGTKRIIDIGCGRAAGYLPYCREFDIVGVDFGDNIAYCQQSYDWGTWIDCDLGNEVPDVDTKDAAIVCADVLEHLPHPECLLMTIMQAVVCAKFVILTTPDRLRTYGFDHPGMPGNKSHCREWTLDELTALLESCGLGIAWRGWTISNNVDRLKNTSLVVCTRRDKCCNLSLETVFDLEAAK